MTDDITQHLAETRRIAKAATPGPWEAWKTPHGTASFRSLHNGAGLDFGGIRDAEHIAHMDPAHTLRLVQALEVACNLAEDTICDCGEPKGYVCCGCATLNRIAAILGGGL